MVWRLTRKCIVRPVRWRWGWFSMRYCIHGRGRGSWVFCFLLPAQSVWLGTVFHWHRSMPLWPRAKQWKWVVALTRVMQKVARNYCMLDLKRRSGRECCYFQLEHNRDVQLDLWCYTILLQGCILWLGARQIESLLNSLCEQGTLGHDWTGTARHKNTHQWHFVKNDTPRDRFDKFFNTGNASFFFCLCCLCDYFCRDF